MYIMCIYIYIDSERERETCENPARTYTRSRLSEFEPRGAWCLLNGNVQRRDLRMCVYTYMYYIIV